MILLKNEDFDKIRTKAITERIENLDMQVRKGIVPETIIEEMKNLDADRWEKKAGEKEEAKPQLKKTPTIAASVRKHLEPLKIRVVKNSLEREVLLNRPDLRNASAGKSGLLVESKTQKETYQPFGTKADP